MRIVEIYPSCVEKRPFECHIVENTIHRRPSKINYFWSKNAITCTISSKKVYLRRWPPTPSTFERLHDRPLNGRFSRERAPEWVERLLGPDELLVLVLVQTGVGLLRRLVE